MSFIEFEFVERPQDFEDILRVNRNENRIHARMSCVSFLDKDLGQQTLFVPSLRLLSKGDTIAKARRRMRNLVQKAFREMLTENPSEFQSQLFSSGFRREEGEEERYSKVWVDNLGELNADERTVKYGALVS